MVIVYFSQELLPILLFEIFFIHFVLCLMFDEVEANNFIY